MSQNNLGYRASQSRVDVFAGVAPCATSLVYKPLSTKNKVLIEPPLSFQVLLSYTPHLVHFGLDTRVISLASGEALNSKKTLLVCSTFDAISVPPEHTRVCFSTVDLFLNGAAKIRSVKT